MQNESNTILKSVKIIDIRNKNTDWRKQVNNYMEMVNLNTTQIKTLSIIQIKNEINEWITISGIGMDQCKINQHLN